MVRPALVRTADPGDEVANRYSPESVMILTPRYFVAGGVEVHAIELAEALRQARVAVTLAVGAGPEDGETPPYVRVVDGLFPHAVSTGAFSSIVRLIEEVRPDIVHTHGIFDQSALSALQAHAPVVQSVHNYFTCSSAGLRYFAPGHECHRPHGPPCLANALFRNCGHRRIPRASLRDYRGTSEMIRGLRAADAVIAYSAYVAEDLRTNGIIGATATRPFVHDRVGSVKRAVDDRRVLFAGRVVPYKGLDVLIRAMARVDATLEVHGDGWGMKRCHTLVRRLAIEERVTFFGWSSVADLDEAYRRCAVVAVPSLWPEPFGLVGLEAMMNARPVVASRTGGIQEWLVHGETGYLVKPGDPGSLSEALERLLADPGLSWQMGRMGRKAALERFTVEQHLSDLAAVYESARASWSGMGPPAGSSAQI